MRQEILTWEDVDQLIDALLPQLKGSTFDAMMLITRVKSRIEAAGGFPDLCVLHYNPTRTLFTKQWPAYYAAVTNARIIYPWEIERGSGLQGVLAPPPETN